MPLDPGSRKMPDGMDANEVSIGSERSRSHHLDRLLTISPQKTIPYKQQTEPNTRLG